MAVLPSQYWFFPPAGLAQSSAAEGQHDNSKLEELLDAGTDHGLLLAAADEKQQSTADFYSQPWLIVIATAAPVLLMTFTLAMCVARRHQSKWSGLEENVK